MMADVTKLIVVGSIAVLLAPLIWWAIKRDFNSFITGVKDFIPDEKALKLYNQDHRAKRFELTKRAAELRGRLKRTQPI